MRAMAAHEQLRWHGWWSMMLVGAQAQGWVDDKSCVQGEHPEPLVQPRGTMTIFDPTPFKLVEIDTLYCAQWHKPKSRLWLMTGHIVCRQANALQTTKNSDHDDCLCSCFWLVMVLCIKLFEGPLSMAYVLKNFATNKYLINQKQWCWSRQLCQTAPCFTKDGPGWDVVS